MGLLEAHEQVQLIKLLSQLPNLSYPETRTSLLVNVQQDIPRHPAPVMDIRAIVENVDGNSAQRTNGTWPILLVIDKAIEMFSAGERATDLQRFRDDVLARRPYATQSQGDPFNAFRLVMAQRPFLNREQLRRVFREQLYKPNKAQALIVNGPPTSGKSYTEWYVRHLADCFGGSRCAYIDFKKEASNFNHRLLAERIVDEFQLGRDIIPNEDYAVAPWIKSFCAQLFGRVNQKSERLWLMLDSFHQIELPFAQNIQDLILELLERAYRNTKFKIVLMGYKETEIAQLGPDISDYVERDEIPGIDTPEDLNSFLQHLHDFFQCHYENAGMPKEEAVTCAKRNLEDVVTRAQRKLESFSNIADSEASLLGPLWEELRAVNKQLMTSREVR